MWCQYIAENCIILGDFNFSNKDIKIYNTGLIPLNTLGDTLQLY